jgi:hypothetical protein
MRAVRGFVAFVLFVSLSAFVITGACKRAQDGQEEGQVESEQSSEVEQLKQELTNQMQLNEQLAAKLRDAERLLDDCTRPATPRPTLAPAPQGRPRKS